MSYSTREKNSSDEMCISAFPSLFISTVVSVSSVYRTEVPGEERSTGNAGKTISGRLFAAVAVVPQDIDSVVKARHAVIIARNRLLAVLRLS